MLRAYIASIVRAATRVVHFALVSCGDFGQAWQRFHTAAFALPHVARRAAGPGERVWGTIFLHKELLHEEHAEGRIQPEPRRLVDWLHGRGDGRTARAR